MLPLRASQRSLSPPNHIIQRLSLFLASQETSNLPQTHALVLTSGNSGNAFIAAKLIARYAALAKPAFSARVFRSADPKDTFLWNSLIKAHFSNARLEEALGFFLQMRASGFAPDKFTLPMVAVACADLSLLCFGRSVHGITSKLGFCSDSAVVSSFVYMYSKCGWVGDARDVFEYVTVRDVVAWTTLIVGYVQNGESEKALECLCEMHRAGCGGDGPNFRTLQVGLQACGNLGALTEGRLLHGLLVKNGIGCLEEVKSSILSMYSKCGNPAEAYSSFSEMTDKDLVSWMSVITVYSRFGLMSRCVSLFREMHFSGEFPDEKVISCVLCGFGNSMLVKAGKVFHGLITRHFYSSGEMISNTLLIMYVKFGLLTTAEKLFSGMQRLTGESCSTMISGYHKAGYGAKCLQLFRMMHSKHIEASSESLASSISSCCKLGATHLGRSLHCHAIKRSMDKNISVANSLIDMYGKNGDLSSAWRIFCTGERDLVTWNTMMSCHNHCENFVEATALFDEMISVSKKVKPNAATLVIVLSACSRLASLEKGENVHRYIKERGLEINLPLGTALVDMYAKCGQLERSRQIFDSTAEKDVVSWNVMISGYGVNGEAESAIDLYKEMNVKPNELTFLSLLTACSHSGMVEEGKLLFSKMQDECLKPDLKHYACMVDLLGRVGNLQEAEALILSMPVNPDGGVWGSLLNACIKHVDSDMGERVARRAIESDPGNDGYYITLSNIYGSSGRWEEAESVRRAMKERGVHKQSGWSTA